MRLAIDRDAENTMAVYPAVLVVFVFFTLAAKQTSIAASATTAPA